MNSLDIKTLPFSSKAALTWSFFWRGLVVGIASSLVGGLLGFVLGFAMAVARCPIQAIQIMCGLAGLVGGCFFLYLYVRWLLSSRLGAFRLKLVPADDLA